MSRQRKRDAVLRLLRGEDLEMASRSLGVTAAALTAWRDTFLAAGEAGLATRPADGEALESERPKARLGEYAPTQELLEAKIAAWRAGAVDRVQPRRRCGRRGGPRRDRAEALEDPNCPQRAAAVLGGGPDYASAPRSTGGGWRTGPRC
jgi:hypothetical protein